MSDVEQTTEQALLAKWCCGNEHAHAFLNALFDASHAADDIVDGDSKDPCADMVRVWVLFFGQIMPNPFFLAHADRFSGAIVPAVVDWRLSTAWQGDSDEVKRLYAYVLRETLEHAVTLTAFILGGAEHAYECREELSSVYHVKEGREPILEWLQEH